MTQSFRTMVSALVALSGSLLFGQDLTGSWQGTLQLPDGRELRMVIKVAKDGSNLSGQMFSIDQGGQPMAVSPVTLQGTAVKMTVPGVGGTYEGKVDADGNSITGNWIQGPNPVPLPLKRATKETAWAIPEPPPPPVKMAEDANPIFEVATVKPSSPDRQGRNINVRGRQFTTGNTSLSGLIAFALGIHPKQITNAPSWVESEKWDITAQPDGEGQPNEKQWKGMLMKLLAERFNLKYHSDKKEMAVYAITVAKNGPKLTKSTGDPNGLPGLGFRGLGNLVTRNAAIRDLASLMQGIILDRPVIDQTGLPGRFDFTLTWQPDEFQFGGRPPQAPPLPKEVTERPDLFTAMQEQLGLKMESTKAPADVIVIDTVEKPSAN
jgi:uncharacterized protein (TIGR03435 family)